MTTKINPTLSLGISSIFALKFFKLRYFLEPMFASCSKNEECQSGYCISQGPHMCVASLTNPNGPCIPTSRSICSVPWYIIAL